MNKEMTKLVEMVAPQVDNTYYSFETTLSELFKNKIKNVRPPKHQRDLHYKKENAIRWVCGMLTNSLISLVNENQPKAVSSVSFGNVRRSLGGRKMTSNISQRFGVWYNTSPETNGYQVINVEDGQHRQTYYYKFCNNELRIDESDVNKYLENYDQILMKKIFAFCGVSELSYAILENMNLNGLIDDVKVIVDVIYTDDRLKGASLFRKLNDSINVTGADTRKNTYTDYYVWDLFNQAYSAVSSINAGSATIAKKSYSENDIKALKFVMPVKKNTFNDLLMRCMLISEHKTDANDWVKTDKQKDIATKLFNRYPNFSNEASTDIDNVFTGVIDKLILLGKSLMYTQDNISGKGLLFGVSDYTRGITAFHSAFIMATNQFEELYGKKSEKEYAEILFYFSTAIINCVKKYNVKRTTIGYLKNSGYNYSNQLKLAKIFVSVGEDCERNGYRF